MPRLAACLGAILLVSAPACGKDKQADTLPSGGSAGAVGDGANPEDVDPQGGMPGGGGGDFGGPDAPEGGLAGDDGFDDDGAGGGGDGQAAPPREISPPTVDKPPEQVRALVDQHMREGIAAMNSGRPDDAIVSARKALKEDEVSVDAMVLLGWAYYEKSFYDKSEAILDIALKRPEGAGNHRLHFIRGLVYDKTDRPALATESYRAAVDADPSYASALMNLGAKHLDSKRYGDAVQVFERITGQLGKNTATAWTNLGSAYRGRSADLHSDRARRNELLLKAETAYKRAVSADKSYPPVYFNLGLLYLDADPFPAPGGSGDMDTLERLERARTYFREYRNLPGADIALVDETDQVAQKLYEREETRREKKRILDERRRQREERQQQQEGGDATE